MKTVIGRLLVIVALTAAGSLAARAEGEVNIYSARQEALIKPLLERFTADTGIRANLVTAKADALVERLEAEGRNSPADILITVDAGRLHRAKVAGVLQPVASGVVAAAVPAHLRDPDGYWVGLSMRARPIMHAHARVEAEELSTYEDLADARWRGRICIRSSSNIYNQSLVASMIAAHGEDETLAWLEGLVANFARDPQGGDRDQIKAVAAGECDLAIANTYYLGGMLNSDDAVEREAAEQVAVFWPNQNGRGAHVNVSGAGVTAAAPNRDNAIRFLEYAVTDDAQQWYAEVNYEYPVKPGVQWSETLQGFGEFQVDALNLATLGELNATAVMLMDRAGWR